MKTTAIFKTSDALLKDMLCKELEHYHYAPLNTPLFLYAEGDAPYMLVAHLDTVHKESPSIICYSKDGNYMMSPQGIGGDDRCGVYIILELLKRLEWKPHVLFTMSEEIGGIGADAFAKYMEFTNQKPVLKYIVEYDRKGNTDAVFYDCANNDFVDFVEQFGFEEDWGTYSDICSIAPALGVAAVNLSSGYYNPHTEHEYVSQFDMKAIIEKSVNMLNAKCDKFKYVKKPHIYYQSGSKTTAECPWHYTEVEAAILPQNSVYIGDDRRANEYGEIAVGLNDATIYIYDDAFGDYTPCTQDIMEVNQSIWDIIYDKCVMSIIDVYCKRG